MRHRELMLFYEYFLSRINKLENDYIVINNNMRRKSYKYCDPVDFLDLMILKNELDYTIQIYYELKMLFNL